jgi:ABC-type Na+ transport system ATPase subunit NatA
MRNGAGKTTTMRIILGLAAPTSGTALVDGQRIVRPLRQVGTLLDATAVHDARTAYDHLLSVALSNGIGRSRVTQVLELAGLSAVATHRVRGFSLGMKQRLGIAAAPRSFLDQYEVHQAGRKTILEYWIPAGDLPALNASIVGTIEVTAEYR